MVNKSPYFSADRIGLLRQRDQQSIAMLERELNTFPWAADILKMLAYEEGKIYCSEISDVKLKIRRDLGHDLAASYNRQITLLQNQLHDEFMLHLGCKNKDRGWVCDVLQRIDTIPTILMERILNQMKRGGFPSDQYQVLFNKIDKRDRRQKLTNLCKELELGHMQFLFQKPI